jgi:hypothetical protein
MRFLNVRQALPLARLQVNSLTPERMSAAGTSGLLSALAPQIWRVAACVLTGGMINLKCAEAVRLHISREGDRD